MINETNNEAPRREKKIITVTQSIAGSHPDDPFSVARVP